MVKRDYIVARAASMFETQGVKSVRIDDIASELGMSKRTLYEMFDSKETLLKECMRHLFVEKQEKMWQEIERLPDVVAVIFFLIDKQHNEKANRERNERIRNNLQKFYPQVAQYVEEQISQIGYEAMRELFERGIREGLFRRDMKIDLSISIFANTLMLIAMNKIKLHNNISMYEAFEYMAINFFRGIATVKGVELIDAYHRKYRSSVQDGRTD